MIPNKSVESLYSREKDCQNNKKHKKTHTQLRVCKRKEVILPKEKQITNRNRFYHLMKFSSILFHIFFRVVKLLSYATPSLVAF